jgi:imidazolonepropionase-like amidohydrolase
MEQPHADRIFVGATLIDGTGSPPRSDTAVAVRDGRISWVGPASDLDQENATHCIDVRGKYLIPGLMDANVHLVLRIDPEVLLKYGPGEYDELVLEAAQIALKAGITTVFDTWGPLQSIRRIRDHINEGGTIGSRIFCAGNIIGNNGPWSANFVPAYSSMNPAVVARVNRHWEQGVGGELAWMSSDAARDVVREYIATSGIDFVKYASAAHGARQLIALSPDVQRGIVEEAHAAGMTAQACAGTPETLKLAIEAGVDLLQHGTTSGLYPMTQETMDLIVSRQLPCVVLLYTDRHVATIPESFRTIMLVKDDNDRRIIKAGGKLMQATDGGIVGPNWETSPWLGSVAGCEDLPWRLGESHILWLQAARDHEMAPMDALLAMTRNIAEAYDKDDELGTLEPGKRADLLVLDADPLEDPENYRRIMSVVKDGVVIDRDRLPEHPVLTQGAT